MPWPVAYEISFGRVPIHAPHTPAKQMSKRNLSSSCDCASHFTGNTRADDRCLYMCICALMRVLLRRQERSVPTFNEETRRSRGYRPFKRKRNNGGDSSSRTRVPHDFSRPIFNIFRLLVRKCALHSLSRYCAQWLVVTRNVIHDAPWDDFLFIPRPFFAREPNFRQLFNHSSLALTSSRASRRERKRRVRKH
jgi:hypothetical protein